MPFGGKQSKTSPPGRPCEYRKFESTIEMVILCTVHYSGQWDVFIKPIQPRPIKMMEEKVEDVILYPISRILSFATFFFPLNIKVSFFCNIRLNKQ